MSASSEYQELKALGLSDHTIHILRNSGATHGAIKLYAMKHAQDDKITIPMEHYRDLLKRIAELEEGKRSLNHY